MEKGLNITALGEILIDYTPMPNSQSKMKVFEQNPGGAPANVLAAATKLGQKTAFIGKIGCDMQGEFLRQTLENAKIETKGVISDPNFFTTLAFVSLSETGERSFAFARKPGADTQLTKDEVNTNLLENTKIFHFGSLSLTHNPSRDASIFAIEKAKESGAIISYDPNYRALLWDSVSDAMEKMRSVLGYVDVLKISDEETKLITGEEEPFVAAEILIKMGISLVVITLGADGALVATKEGAEIVKGFKANVVDTTGAGDAFWGGFLYSLGESGKKPSEVSFEEAKAFAKFANAVASICVSARGAIPAMPNLEDVLKVLG